MFKIPKSNCIICSKKEIRMLDSLGMTQYIFIYELPLFGINQKPIDIDRVKTKYVLLRNSEKDFKESFLDKINKSWDKQFKNEG